jgi:hypothetical protein
MPFAFPKETSFEGAFHWPVVSWTLPDHKHSQSGHSCGVHREFYHKFPSTPNLWRVRDQRPLEQLSGVFGTNPCAIGGEDCQRENEICEISAFVFIYATFYFSDFSCFSDFSDFSDFSYFSCFGRFDCPGFFAG